MSDHLARASCRIIVQYYKQNEKWGQIAVSRCGKLYLSTQTGACSPVNTDLEGVTTRANRYFLFYMCGLFRPICQ